MSSSAENVEKPEHPLRNPYFSKGRKRAAHPTGPYAARASAHTVRPDQNALETPSKVSLTEITPKTSQNIIRPMQIVRIYVSDGHNFFGHHGKPPGEYPIRNVASIECVAGSGIRGDRFFDFKPDYKGQITFFDESVWIELCNTFQIHHLEPGVLRRNVILRDVDLPSLIGKEFEIQGVRFLGTGECSPCYWMESACHPGTEAFLKNRGGLRAKILTSGILRTSTNEQENHAARSHD
jgi:hypothetical protein